MPGVVETTDTFTDNQVITSTLMNNIIDQTLFTSDALANGTLSLTAGKMKVATGGITANEMASNAVTVNTIADGVITDAKINASAAIALSKLATGALPTAITIASANIVDGTIVTADIADASITAPKLDGAQTGTAPIYGIRAAGEYTQSNPRVLTTGFNIATVTRTSGGVSQISFTTPMPNSDYVVLVGLGRGASGFSRPGPSVAHTLTTSGFTMEEPDDASDRGVSFYVIG
jgi:hypothetical protein